MFTIKPLNLLSLFLTLTTTSVWAAPASNKCDDILTDKILLYADGATIRSDASRETVSQMRRTLEKIDHVAKSNRSMVTLIYSKLQNEITETLEFAQKLETKDRLLQNEVFLLAFRFTLLVEAPIEFVNYIGHYADGVDLSFTFNNKQYAAVVEELKDRFSWRPEVEFLDSWSKSYAKKFKQKPYYTLNKKDFSIGGIDAREATPDQFFFQYQYVAKQGLLTLRQLFAEREKGTIYYGVSKHSRADFDGQHGTADLFLNHDIFHGFIQRTQDALLFSDLGITDIETARALKQENHNLLKARLAELDKLDNPQLRAAIEVVFFALLHEEGHSYPLQVDLELRNQKRYDYYIRGGAHFTEEGVFGEEHRVLVADGGEELFARAVKWVEERVEEDSAAIKARLGYTLTLRPEPSAQSDHHL